MALDPITGVAKANDKYRAQLRSTWISSPADTSLLVTAVPSNLPTIVVVGWETDLETVFSVTGASGDSSANYALTGVVRLKGANSNIPENTPINCLNNEEFFNQYETKMNEIVTGVNSALEVVDALDDIVNGDFVTVSDAASMEFDLADGVNRKFKTTALGGNRTFTIANPQVGQPFVIRVLQGGTAREPVWFETITWQGIGTPDVSADIAATKVGTYGFICTDATSGSEKYDGFFMGAEE